MAADYDGNNDDDDNDDDKSYYVNITGIINNNNNNNTTEVVEDDLIEILPWIGLVMVLLLVLSVIATAYITIRSRDHQRQRFNANDWHIEERTFVTPTIGVRCCDAIGSGCGALCASNVGAWFLNRLWIQPALRHSLWTMLAAEESGFVPSVLCNEQARMDMEERVVQVVEDIRTSPTLTTTAKVLFAGRVGRSLRHHAGLLKLGMSTAVAAQTVEEPVFFVRFPRTSTTLLHRTMALDHERFRHFDMCDMLSPLSSQTTGALGPVPRNDFAARRRLARKVQRRLFGWLDWLFPRYRECLGSMNTGIWPGEAGPDWRWYDSALGFPSMDLQQLLYPQLKEQNHPWETREVARYRYAWLDMVMRIHQQVDDDFAAAKGTRGGTTKKTKLAQEKDVEVAMVAGEATKLLIGNGYTDAVDRRPWLMKDPNHAAYLSELIEQFPDAKLVFTHRNPIDVVSAMAKLSVCYSSVYHIPGQPGTASTEWGKESLRRLRRLCHGMVEFTEDCNEAAAAQASEKYSKWYSGSKKNYSIPNGSHRIDFQFIDLACNIPKAIGKIYAKFYPNDPIPSAKAMAAFEKYLDKVASRTKPQVRQVRNLQEFGLDVPDIEYQCDEYSEMFITDGRGSRRRFVGFTDSTSKV